MSRLRAENVNIKFQCAQMSEKVNVLQNESQAWAFKVEELNTTLTHLREANKALQNMESNYLQTIEMIKAASITYPINSNPKDTTTKISSPGSIQFPGQPKTASMTPVQHAPVVSIPTPPMQCYGTQSILEPTMPQMNITSTSVVSAPSSILLSSTSTLLLSANTPIPHRWHITIWFTIMIIWHIWVSGTVLMAYILVSVVFSFVTTFTVHSSKTTPCKCSSDNKQCLTFKMYSSERRYLSYLFHQPSMTSFEEFPGGDSQTDQPENLTYLN